MPDASYLWPLRIGLRKSPHHFDLLVDLPAQLAIKLQQRIGNLRCAILSPIDYARHGGDYRIVPAVAVSSCIRSGCIQLYINRDVKDIRTLAVDIRVTSEIILAKIILAEKFPNSRSSDASLQFIPMLPDRATMMHKADAALIVNPQPVSGPSSDDFALDLVDEWYDMTGLPYVHGCWVGYEDEGSEIIVRDLLRVKELGVAHLDEVAKGLASDLHLAPAVAAEYFSAFSYDLGQKEQESLTEFMKYAFYHGVLQDVPDLNFFESDPPPSTSVD